MFLHHDFMVCYTCWRQSMCWMFCDTIRVDLVGLLLDHGSKLFFKEQWHWFGKTLANWMREMWPVWKKNGLVSYFFGRVATPLRSSRVFMQKHFQIQACNWDSLRKPAASTKTKLNFSLARMVSALNIHHPHWRWQVHHTVRKKPSKRPSTHVPSLCCTTLENKARNSKDFPKVIIDGCLAQQITLNYTTFFSLRWSHIERWPWPTLQAAICTYPARGEDATMHAEAESSNLANLAKGNLLSIVMVFVLRPPVSNMRSHCFR